MAYSNYETSPNSGLPIYPPGYFGSGKSSSSRDTYSDDYYGDSSLQAQLSSARREQEEAADAKRAAYERALRSQYSTSLGALGQSAAGANTSEYVRYMQNQKNLPQQAALMGTGGLSESSLTGLNAAYGSNLNAIEQERARGQASLESQLAQGLAAGEGNYADTMSRIGSDYASQLINLSLQQQADQAARERAIQDQANIDREFAFKQSQAARKLTGGFTSGVTYGDEEPKYGKTSGNVGSTSNASWNNMVSSVITGQTSRSEISRSRDSLIARYGQDGYDALYSIAR